MNRGPTRITSRARFDPTRCVAALLAGLFAGFVPAISAPTSYPGLALNDLDHQWHDLTEFRGKVVVVNFWATWCVPCREEMPVFVRLQESRGASGVQVVGASADGPGKEREIQSFARDMGIGFPIWVGATTVDMERLGLGSALPATVLFDRDGTIVARIAGIVDEEGLDRWVEWLLGDRSDPAPPPPVRVPIEPGAHDDHHDHHHEAGVGLDGPSFVPS